MNRITSVQNQHIKDVNKLSKRAVRDERRLTVVEGLREVSRALESGVIPLEAYLCPELSKSQEAHEWRRLIQQLAAGGTTQLYEVTREVFARLAYREESDGFLIVIPYLAHQLEELPLGAPPFLCVIEGVEKPGNLGAILRSADAAGVDGVIVCAGATDLHNPNVIRASLGTLFTVPVVETPTSVAIDWLHTQGIRIVTAAPDASTLYTESMLTGPVALVMGSEAHGLGAAWLEAADLTVSIPMYGMADSLNLATATALMLYEVVRQRQIKPAQQLS